MNEHARAAGTEYVERLLREADVEALAALPPEELRRGVERRVSRMLEEARVILPRAEYQRVVQGVVDEVAGYGPLEPLLHDPAITEIMVNAPDAVFVERQGRIQPAAVRFRDRDHIRHIIDRITARVGRRVDEFSPMVDARLPDGSRINAVIPPVSVGGPILTIRKFQRRPLSLRDLVELGALTPEAAGFLRAAVRARLNILISGGTGTGKTTLLAALAAEIPPTERVITIEDMVELRVPHPHVLALEARPPNVEGKGEVPIRQLVRNALRMRPDRIIVGEVRGEEALDMLQAMNTGHEGSLTTLHANSPADAFSRLEAMVLMAGTLLPVRVVREHLVAALDLVVQVQRLPDGHRRVVEIADVTRVPGGRIVTSPVFTATRTGPGSGPHLAGHGSRSRHWPRLVEAGAGPRPD
ncbi:CpaF family protein [Caldinitratiruptor microaerophilus]|uniref:Type II/IV secretion system-related protein n=1 Tax=Caldinitratiruptor microaerophilus TaxID=671077 RepID=A0AA35G7J0_9FIRM|nr:CpaF family protein [Caldinitratiruptor microaerophilus]BDG59930.1 type II/IV secretion system-related protein [Caldinitratiruptor microaerophilus]